MDCGNAAQGGESQNAERRCRQVIRRDVRLILLAFVLILVLLVARLVLVKLKPGRSQQDVAAARKRLDYFFLAPPLLIGGAIVWFLLKVVSPICTSNCVVHAGRAALALSRISMTSHRSSH